MDGCMTWMFSTQPKEKFFKRRVASLSFDHNAFIRIGNPSGQTQLSGEPMHKRPKADALNSASNGDADSFHRRHNVVNESIQASMPAPVFAESSNTRMPGRTVWI